MDNSDMNCEVDVMKRTTIRYGKTMWLGLVFTTLCGGCATPSSEEDFGNSVRQMINAQKYTPPQPQEQRLPTLDGQKGEAAIKQYRTDVANPERIYTDTSHGSKTVGR